MENIFEGAKYGDKFVARNGTIAYYCRYINEGKQHHGLMVNDSENDFIRVYDDGKVFHVLEEDWDSVKVKGKSVYEVYGWDRESMLNHRLDIISRYEG